jgi:hypothetical protein
MTAIEIMSIGTLRPSRIEVEIRTRSELSATNIAVPSTPLAKIRIKLLRGRLRTSRMKTGG